MENKQDTFVMNLKGSLDSVTAADFWQYLKKKQTEGYCRFLFNCDSLDFITSGGISILLKLSAQKNEMAYAMIGLNHEVITLFELLGLMKKIPIFNSRKQAENFLNEFTIQEDIEGGIGFSFHQTNTDLKLEIEESADENIELNEGLPTSDFIKDKKEAENENFVPRFQERIVHYSKIPLSEDFTEKTSVFIEKVMQCESCGSRLRIKQTGKHKCPCCFVEFEVKSGDSITYMEKLI